METSETPPQMSETPPQTSEAPPQVSETPPETSPERKKPTTRIALLAGICLVILGISVWALVAAQMPSDATVAVNEPLSGNASTERDTNTPTQANSTTNAADEKPQEESSNPAAGGSENAANAPGDTTGGSAGDGSAGDASAGAAGNSGGSQGGSTPANPGGNAAPASQPINVTLSVSCNVAIEAGSATARAVSDNGAMRYATLRLNAGTSVYDALVASGAALSTQGSLGSPLGVYVSAIDGLPQGEAGPQSGWKYYVNGSAPGMSCDKCMLSNGDTIEWRYVTNA